VKDSQAVEGAGHRPARLGTTHPPQGRLGTSATDLAAVRRVPPRKRDQLRRRSWSPEEELGGQRGRPLPLRRLTTPTTDRCTPCRGCSVGESGAGWWLRRSAFSGAAPELRRKPASGMMILPLPPPSPEADPRQNLPPPSKSPVRGQRAMTGYHPPALRPSAEPRRSAFSPFGLKGATP
jgi:hypothetical protein